MTSGVSIPTTNASTLASSRSHFKGRESSFAHCLNNSASVLVHHGRRLMGNCGECGFLQQIAVTSCCMSVLLIYLEGMIFPSIYWHVNVDRSLLRALPSPLMDEQKHTSQFGFAGVMEHTRARLQNLSLLSSTDP